MKFFLAKDGTSQHIQCKYAVKIDSYTKQINISEHFPHYLDCQNNRYEIDSLGKDACEPIPYSS